MGRPRKYKTKEEAVVVARKQRKEYREAHRKSKRTTDASYQRKRRAENPGLKAEEYRKYTNKYPEKVKAHRELNRAVIKGIISRSPCEVCGKDYVHAHHDDYSNPLFVRWLCPVHHKQVHAK